MSFLRGAWRFLVGIKDALALLFLLLLFALLWAATRAGAPLTVPGGSALVLDIEGVIVDQASERSPVEMIADSSDFIPEVEVRDLIDAIDRAAKDDRVRSIVLDLDGFYGAGMANLQSVGGALRSFKSTGKPVYAYSTAYIDDSYYLAAHASESWLNPLGAVLLTGPGGSNLYFADALQKLGVDVNVFRVGTYKSAVEPFTRTEASPEARAANQALVDTLWDIWTTDVQAVRPAAKIDAIIANLPARIRAANGNFSTQAIRDGLVDKVGTEVDFGRQMAQRVGKGDEDRPGAYNQIGYRDYLRASAPLQSAGPAVGIVYVAGEILDGETGRGLAGGDSIAELIAKATANGDIKALVVRVDSPGGSVLASEKIRQALVNAKTDGLPVVASFGPVAASGGYWIATAADEIFAQPSSITGSIGVFAVIPTFEKTLDKLGINADGVKSTPYSGEPDLLQGMTPGVRSILQASVEDMYRRFIGLVSKARDLPPARVDELAQGRVWAGGTAHQLQLVDRLGSLDAAVIAAAKRAGIDGRPRTVDIEPAPSFPLQVLEQFVGPRDQQQGGDALARLVRAGQVRALSAVSDAAQVAKGPTMQARCLSCAGLAPRIAGTKEARGWLAALAQPRL